MALGLGVAVTVFWAARIVLPGHQNTLPSSDVYLLYLPAYEVAYRWIRAGILPIWNPYILCGIPWVAALQEGFFYPLHAVYLVLPGPAGLAISSVLHLALIAITTALFARRAGLGFAAAVLAAVLCTMRGHIAEAVVTAPPQLEAVTWLPLGALAVLGLARGEGPRAAGLLAIAAAASLLAGYPQISAYVVYAWAFLLPAFLISEGAGARRWVAAAVGFAGGLALGALAAGIQLLPALEMIGDGARTSQPISMNAMFPFGSFLWGNPAAVQLRHEAISGSRFSFGAVGLSLIPAAIVARRLRPRALGIFGLGVLTLLFSLGPFTPLFRLYLALPTLAWFRAPNRILYVTEFCFATLAAMGLDAVIEGRNSAPRRIPVARWVTLIGLAAAAALVLAGVSSSGSAYPVLLVSAAGAALLLAAGWRGAPRGALLAGSIIVLAMLELLQAKPQQERMPYDEASEARYLKHSRTFTMLASLAGPTRVWVYNSGMQPEVCAKRVALYRLRSMDDYEPVNLRRQAEYFTYFIDGSATISHWPWVFQGNLVSLKANGNAPAPATRRRLLDLAAVRFMVFSRLNLFRPDLRAFLQDAGFKARPLPTEPLTEAGFELLMFENPHALPRAYVVYRTRAAPPTDELLGIISQESFDPLVESYVEGDPGFTPAPNAPPRGAAARILEDAELAVEVQASLAAPGLLVLADTFYTGWHATVDGNPAPILQTNHLFRGVPVPAGRHTIRFEYRPWSFAAGAVASLAGLLAIMTLLVWTGRGRGRAREPARAYEIGRS